jgi:hypothetical protein
MLTMVVTSMAFAGASSMPAAQTATPTISSEFPDYGSGETVNLFGTGWQAGESVHIFVNDDYGSSWSRNVDVVAGDDGTITDTFQLPYWFVATYYVTATGVTSGIATTTFTDATISLSPISGSVGTIVTVTSGAGSGGAFAGNTALTFTFGGSPLTTSGCTTNSGGNLPAGCTFTVPSLSAGLYTVRATDGTKAASTTFTVTASNAAPVASAVAISGTAQYGQLLTGNYTYSDADGDLESGTTFRWLRNGSPIAGATASTYTTVAADVSTTLTFEVTPRAATGTSPGAVATSSGVLIGQASSVTTVTCPASVTYTGSALEPCSATVTGAGGLSLTPTPSYSNNTNAGTATASYTYAGDANHTGSNDSENFTIDPAPTTTTVTCAAGPHVYTGSAIEPCTYTVTGANLSIGPNAVPSGNYSNNVNAGSATASFTYSGDANHTGSNDSENFTIDRANADCSVTGYDVVYDTASHTATGSCLGVLGETLAGLDLSGTTHTNPGDYPSDPWTFTDVTGNYNNTNGTVHDNIHFATIGICYGGPSHTILQPINTDGSSSFKQKSTVPVKFRVCDAYGNSIGDASLVFDTPDHPAAPVLYMTSSGAPTTNEDVVSTTPDLVFRWSASDQQWIFNLNTKNLTAGKTYYYHIYLADGTTIDFRFALK